MTLFFSRAVWKRRSRKDLPLVERRQEEDGDKWINKRTLMSASK
jgi:hypothetical protein